MKSWLICSRWYMYHLTFDNAVALCLCLTCLCCNQVTLWLRWLIPIYYLRGEREESSRRLTWSRGRLLLTGLCVTCHHMRTNTNEHTLLLSQQLLQIQTYVGWQKPDISPVEPQIRPRRQATSGLTHTDTHIQKHICDMGHPADHRDR